MGFNKIKILDQCKKTNQKILISESNGIAIFDNKIKNITLDEEKNIIISEQLDLTKEDNTIHYQQNDFKIKTIDLVKNIFSKTLKIEKIKLDEQTTFEKYGVDSLIILELNKKFDEIFENLPSTILFEHMTMEKIADYFIKNHTSIFEKYFQINDEKLSSSNSPAFYTTFQVILKDEENSSKIVHQFSLDEKQNYIDIAIIGVSGRYPQAKNLSKFWELLKNGRNGITEIPLERWQWQDYFDEKEPGKSYSKRFFIIKGVALCLEENLIVVSTNPYKTYHSPQHLPVVAALPAYSTAALMST